MDDRRSSNTDEPPHTRSEHYREIYSNAANIRLGVYDLSVIFSRIKENEPGRPVLEEQVTITMAPGQFKAFLLIAEETFKAHQMLFGSVTIPDELTKPRRTAEEIVAAVQGIAAPPSA